MVTPGAIVVFITDDAVQSTTVVEESTILYSTLNLAAAVDELVFVTANDANF